MALRADVARGTDLAAVRMVERDLALADGEGDHGAFRKLCRSMRPAIEAIRRAGRPPRTDGA
jgi:hypothetical protein